MSRAGSSASSAHFDAGFMGAGFDPNMTWTEQQKLRKIRGEVKVPKYPQVLQGMMLFLDKTKDFSKYGVVPPKASTPSSPYRQIMSPADVGEMKDAYSTTYAKSFSRGPSARRPPLGQAASPSVPSGHARPAPSTPVTQHARPPSTPLLAQRAFPALPSSDVSVRPPSAGMAMEAAAVSHSASVPDGLSYYLRAKDAAGASKGRFSSMGTVRARIARNQASSRDGRHVGNFHGAHPPRPAFGTPQAAAGLGDLPAPAYVQANEIAGMDARQRLSVLDKLKRFDVNKDGTIDFDEFRKACVVFGKSMSNQKLQDVFRKMDTDKSGNISLKEFITSDLMGWQDDRETNAKGAKGYTFGMAHENTGHGRVFGAQREREQKAREAAHNMKTNREVSSQMAMKMIQQHLGESSKMSGKDLFKAFKFFDTDGNGSLTKEEIGAALETMNIPVSGSVLNSLLRSFDRDGNGNIDYKEFAETFTGQGKAGYYRSLDASII